MVLKDLSVSKFERMSNCVLNFEISSSAIKITVKSIEAPFQINCDIIEIGNDLMAGIISILSHVIAS